MDFTSLINSYPFYKKARELWLDTQINQIIKGIHKYEEPLTPTQWSGEELLTHALEESVDQVHYLVALKEILDVKEATIARLKLKLHEKNREIEELERKEHKLNPLIWTNDSEL